MPAIKRVYILTNGCPENRLDTTRMQEFFRQNDYIITKKIRQADVVLFNACAHTQDSESCSLAIIKRINAIKRPKAKLVVCGCLPKINQKRLRAVHQGMAFSLEETQRLNEIFTPKVKFEDTQANSLIKITKYLDRYSWVTQNLREKGVIISLLKLIEKLQDDKIKVCMPQTFCIKVCSGCLGNCSFCAVRISRGRLKSKPPENIIQEFEQGLKRGYKDLALIGTEVGAYGKDIGLDLVELLEKLINIKGEYKLRLRNIHPVFLIKTMPRLRKILQTGKICFLSCAPESGNNRILKLMNRGYKIEDFKTAVRTLNQEFPEIQLRTQLMVGFPTETEEEFRDTLGLIDELDFDFVETYMFQPRPGTKAATMAGQIPAQIIKRRYKRLLLKALFTSRNGRR